MTDLIIERRWLQDEEGESDRLATFSAVMSNILLFFLIYGLSATVQVRNLRNQLTNKFAIFTGVAMQFLIMPFLGFCAVMMLHGKGFTEPMGLSLLVVTASPGGSYSNWWCSLFNAELALSVAMTSVSSVLSIGLLPANLFLYSWLAYTIVLGSENEQDMDVIGALDFESIFITLAVVLGAIMLGLFSSYKYDNPKFHKRANNFGSFCGISLILFSAFLGSGAGGAETNFWSLGWKFYVGTAFPCVVGMALANVIARTLRLTRPETVAISIECCYQNTAIGTSVAVTMFKDPTARAEAVSVPLFYGLVEAFIIGIYCLWAWKVGWTKAPSDEKICVVITKTYEVEEDSEELERDSAVDAAATNCWTRLFIPREKENQLHNGAENQESPDGEKVKTDARDRFYSSDVTIATTPSSAPGSPETNLSAIEDIDSSQDSAEMVADLEAPHLTRGKGTSISTVLEASETLEVQEQPRPKTNPEQDLSSSNQINKGTGEREEQ